MRPITTLPRRTTVEPILPGDFDHEFTEHVNRKRRSADLMDALWLLRWPLVAVLAFHLTLIAFAVWLVS
jgi:hypothetical protein